MQTKLLELREEKKISQENIAKILGVTRQAYSRYERGERELNYDALVKLSKFFDVSIDYLLGISKYYYPDRWTEVERQQGVVSTFNLQLTPIEDELLTVGREIRDRLGEPALRGFISIGEGIVKNSK